MNKIKKYIIIIVCLIAIVFIALLININLIKSKSENTGDVEEQELNVDTEITNVTNYEDYYTVKCIAESYIEQFLQEDSEGLYNTLDPEYITMAQITQDNVIPKLNLIKNYNINEYQYYKFYIDNMKVSKYKNINTYFIKGTIINKNSGDVNNLSFIVETDTNLNYYINSFEYLKNKGYTEEIKEGQKFEPMINEIDGNDYNQYEIQDMSDNYTIVLDHMSKFTDYIVYNVDYTYNFYDDNYKNSKFKTISEYKDYIQNNIKFILSSSITKYKIVEKDDYIEYICIDQYGNYYIFKDKGVMDYTVMLDTYTIDSEEFTNKYNEGSEKLKVGMNLEKIFQALNRKDYTYIYGKLDDNFKQNYFPTIEDFESYMKNTFFEMNKATYGEFEEKSGVYVYKVELSDATQSNQEDDENDEETSKENSVIKSFIVKLEDNNDYKLAFNVN